MPGDDIRRVDWRLYARTDRYFVKQYEADTNANFVVLLDVSKSMGFASDGRDASSSTRSFLAACLAYLSHRQRDRVGIVTFDEESSRTCRRRRSTSTCCCTRSIARSPSGRAGCWRCSTSWPSTSSAAVIVALISDLYENPADLIEALKPYRVARQRRRSCSTCSIRPRSSFPYTDASRFQDLESGEEVPVVPEVFAEQYRQMMKEHIEALDGEVLGVAHRLHAARRRRSRSTRRCSRYLGNRERLMRVR